LFTITLYDCALAIPDTINNRTKTAIIFCFINFKYKVRIRRRK
jgi:hypothetical protein